MPAIARLPEGQAIRLIGEAEARTFSVFLGAGASKSSGVPLASEMIAEWRKMAFNEAGPPNVDFESWCKEDEQQAWFGKPEEYSILFEKLFPDERARQRYMEAKIEGASPSWGYLYLANLMQYGFFNICFTTNFDDLLHQALSTYAGYNPIVCSADSQVMSISIMSRRAKIIKLHGDYLFKKLKNTCEELKQLDPNMAAKLGEFAKVCGMVVLGYNGQDVSIMSILEELLQNERCFESGVFWGIRRGSEPSSRVSELMARFPHRVRTFEFGDFDIFMARLHAYIARAQPDLNLKLPKPILEPFEALKQRYRLLTQNETANAKSDDQIEHDRQQLLENLKPAWANTSDTAQLDLLQAQLTLGRRDYKSALEYISKFVEKRPDDIDGLTTFGYVLAQQAEDAHNDSAWDAAVEKWKAAVALEAKTPAQKALQARSGLIRAYWRKQALKEAIVECEALLPLVPGDRSLRETLAQLYSSVGRYDDSLSVAQGLSNDYPEAAQYRMLRASVLEQKGMLNEAREELRRATNLDRNNPWLHFALANVEAKLSHLDEATQEYEEAVRLEPGNMNFRLQAATLYTNRQMLAAALPHLEAAVRIEPNSAEARGWLGQTYLCLGRLTDARPQLEVMLSLSPNDARAEVMAGVLYIRMNMANLAEQHLRAAIQANFHDPRAWFWLGIYFRLQNRLQELQEVRQTLAQMDAASSQMLELQLSNWQMAVSTLFGAAPAAQPQFNLPQRPDGPFGVPQFGAAQSGGWQYNQQPPNWPPNPQAANSTRDKVLDQIRAQWDRWARGSH